MDNPDWPYKATILRRWASSIIDGLVLLPVLLPLAAVAFSTDRNWLIQLYYPLVFGYNVYFIWKYGATLGKKWLKIKVVNKEGKNPTFIQAFLRETIGKFLSGLFLLGYLWAIWDKDRQTWHDKIASTYVVTPLPNDGKNSGILIVLAICFVIFIPIILILAVVGLTVLTRLQSAERDAQRRYDLVTINRAITSYIQADPSLSLCGTQQPPCVLNSNTNSSNWLPVPVQFNTGKQPVDPLNNDDYYYSYCSDGENWELNATLETGNGQSQGTNGSGDGPKLYEVGSSLALCPPRQP